MCLHAVQQNGFRLGIVDAHPMRHTKPYGLHGESVPVESYFVKLDLNPWKEQHTVRRGHPNVLISQLFVGLRLGTWSVEVTVLVGKKRSRLFDFHPHPADHGTVRCRAGV